MKTSPPQLTLTVDRGLRTPMYLQLCQRFKTAIAQGHLRPGDRVPPVRGLAGELNLARGTVEAAYRLLAEEGYLSIRGAAGTVVSPTLADAARKPSAKLAEAPRLPMTSSGYQAVRPLQLGLPALDEFPRKLWNRLSAHRLRSIGAADLAYPDPAGYWPLRERIATYLGLSRGVACEPQQVFITASYRSTLELILRVLFQPGDRFWFEDPGYLNARRLLSEAGAQLVPVPVDADGLIVDEGRRLAADARFALVTPSHQSPLGVTLSLERRMALLQWASTAGSWIIEDDYDSEYRYRERPLPALKSLDRHDRVIYTGTFSKVLFPGLRVAYMVAPISEAERFRQGCDGLNAGCPQLYQATVADFIAEGHFFRHLKKMRSLYAQRRATMAQALLQVFGDRLSIDLPAGGLHLLAMLNEGEDDVPLADQAQADGMGIQPLSRWYLAAQAKPGLLMGFANVADKEDALRLANRLNQAVGFS